MPATEWGWLIAAEELRGWILYEDERLLVIDKPGTVVCHPSKHGPWSSLVGACREYTGLEVLHMPSRLDRETSGVVVFAKDRELGSLLQRGIQNHKVTKTYLAILAGELKEAVMVDEPLGRAEGALVWMRQAVRADGAASVTEFEPLEWRGGHTLVRVKPRTGRLHQIRVHAAWLGCPVAGDKLYGPDERHFLTFLEHGMTAELRTELGLERQALHACALVYDVAGGPYVFEAPLAADLRAFWDALI